MKVSLLIGLLCLFTQQCYAMGMSTVHRTFTSAEDMQSSDWYSEEESHRAWQHSVVRLPQAGKVSHALMQDLRAAQLPEQPIPVVIYLHGCTGHIAGSIQRMEWLAEQGYGVIGPDSLAREKYPRSCDPYRHQGGLYRETLIMRQQDALYAIKQAKTLEWVDAKNIFVFGHSEGAVTAATMVSPSQHYAVNARVVEGWTCHAVGWEEYGGINAPKSEPVMTLVAKHDPWFQSEYTRGDCGPFINSNNGSQSIVIDKGHLAYEHDLLFDPQLRDQVIDFLRQHSHQ